MKHSIYNTIPDEYFTLEQAILAESLVNRLHVAQGTARRASGLRELVERLRLARCEAQGLALDSLRRETSGDLN